MDSPLPITAPIIHDEKPPAPVSFSARRLVALDGLRGIAILLVLYHHFIPEHLTGNLLSRWAGRFAASAWFGVDLFFVLSGFLITGILFDARRDRHFFRNFYARRTLRVFPLYYGVLAVTLLILPLALHLPFHWNQQPWLWFYGVNLHPLLCGANFNFPSPLGLWYAHFWSLAVEEHFYLVWPLAVFLFARKPLMWISASLAVLALLLRVCMLHWGPDVLFQTTFLRMDGLLLGGWVALAIRRPGGIEKLLRPACLVAAVAGGIMFAMFLHDGGLYRGNRDVMTAGYSLLGVFFAAMLLPIVSSPPNLLQRALGAGWLRFFGRYSYGMYVFHYMLLPQFVKLLPARFPYPITAFICIATLGTVAVAWLSFNLYERWFLGLKRLFESRHVKTAPP